MPPPASADAPRTESKLKHPEDHSSDTEDNEASRRTVEIGHNRRDEVDDKEEDPATQAASENLRQTTISDIEPSESIDTTVMSDVDQTSAKREDEQPGNRMTPEASVATDVQNEDMKERVSSPKKKRGREQDDDPRDAEGADDAEEIGKPPNGAAVNGGRTTRSEPEKKRHRDESADAIAITEPILGAKAASSSDPTKADMRTTTEPEPSPPPSEKSTKPIFGSSLKDIPQPSSSALAGSAFGSLAASSTSGFADLAASKPAVFGASSKSPVSGFGALASASSVIPDSSAVKVGFGSSVSTSSPLSLNSGFTSTSTAGFGALGGGSTFGGGFGAFNIAPGAKLSSFAASGAPSGEKPSKAPKAFGAPESDEDEDEEEDDDETGGDADSEDESVSVDEKKKAKFSKVALDDGEKEEATLIQFRTKLFVLDLAAKAWKERGVGILKLNVPREFVDFDVFLRPIPGTYDPSAGEKNDDDEKTGPPLARIIMRQEGTNKVILNTPVIKAQKFEEQTTNGNRILFTAFEDGKPVNVLLRMKDENLKSFISEIKYIQREL